MWYYKTQCCQSSLSLGPQAFSDYRRSAQPSHAQVISKGCRQDKRREQERKVYCTHVTRRGYYRGFGNILSCNSLVVCGVNVWLCLEVSSKTWVKRSASLSLRRRCKANYELRPPSRDNAKATHTQTHTMFTSFLLASIAFFWVSP